MSGDQKGPTGKSAQGRPSRFHAAAAADWYFSCSVKQPAISGNISYTSNKAQRGSSHSKPSERLPVMTFLAVLEATAVKSLRQAPPVHFTKRLPGRLPAPGQLNQGRDASHSH